MFVIIIQEVLMLREAINTLILLSEVWIYNTWKRRKKKGITQKCFFQ